MLFREVISVLRIVQNTNTQWEKCRVSEGRSMWYIQLKLVFKGLNEAQTNRPE
jgi:hypothetical protein